MDWISVSDRLPEDNVLCLVVFDGMYGLASLRHPWNGRMLWGGHSGSHNAVTHWVALPSLPAQQPADAAGER